MKLSLAGRLAGLATGFALATAFIPGAAGASSSSTGTLTSTATVIQNCTVADQTLAFGNYDPINVNASTGSDKTGSATLTFNCTKGSSSIYVTADQGANHSSAVGTTRAMSDGTNTLSYELYTDSGFTNVWNTTDNGTNDYHPDFSSASSVTTTVYGVIPKGQDAVVSTGYTDAVTMTINF